MSRKYWVRGCFISLTLYFIWFLVPINILGLYTNNTPNWKFEPKMLLWQLRPQDEPYPMTNYMYGLKITNKSKTNFIKDISIFIKSELFDWIKLYGGGKYNSPLFTQSLLYEGGYSWKSKENPEWRKILENSTEFKIQWKDFTGWHEIRGKLPSQYEGNVFTIDDIEIYK